MPRTSSCKRVGSNWLSGAGSRRCLRTPNAPDADSFVSGPFHDGLALLPDDRREYWAAVIEEAEQSPARTFTGNGFTVTALQAACAAVVQTPIPDEVPSMHLRHALDAAVRVGHDTDTVATIAGMLLGARWGASAVPFVWRRMLHGWPGLKPRAWFVWPS